MAEKSIAYRLGWALYWVCLILGALWVGGWFLLDGDVSNKAAVSWLLVSAGIPALLFYGIGRFFRYVLAGD